MSRKKESKKSEQSDDKTAAPLADDHGADDPGVVDQAVAAVADGAGPQETDTGRSTSNLVLPLILGGIVAGAIGFGAATLVKDQPAPAVVDNTDAQQAAADMAEQSAALKSEIAGLKSQIAELQQVVADGPTSLVINGLGKRQDRADRLATAQADEIEQLGERLAGIERRPAPVAGAALESNPQIEAELAAIRQSLADELQRIETAQAELTAANANAAVQVETVTAALAYAEVVNAVNAGGSYQVALSELSQAGVEIPGVLARSAKNGVVTLTQLQEQFSTAARAALGAATREQADQGETSRLGAFLRIQLGARSLTPRQGDDADAILSRAEAALKADDIRTAVEEIGALPGSGQAEMVGWIELAESRVLIKESLAALSVAIGN